MGISYSVYRWFHSASSGVMVSTPAMISELRQMGFQNLVQWTPGVDTTLFAPDRRGLLTDKRPILMYVGRVAVEKSIEEFLDLNLGGSKYVVGDGPDFAKLKAKYPQARFVGYKSGEELAGYYRVRRRVRASQARRTPSAWSYSKLWPVESRLRLIPVRGPLDIIKQGETGFMDEDLGKAVMKALDIDRAKCREFALSHGWTESARQFIDNLAPIRR